MRKIFTIALVLAATLFAATSAKAEGGRVTNDDVWTSKTVKENTDGTYTLTLETYVKGASTTTTEVKRKPADIVLVLDVSGSMSQNYTTTETYTEKEGPHTYNSVGNSTLYYKWTDGTYKQVTRNRTGKSPNYKYSLTFKVGNTTYYLKDNGYTTTETTYSKTTDNIFSGILYSRTTQTVSRIQALKSAVASFIDVIKTDAEENEVDHRISIVHFGNGYPNDNYTNPNSTNYYLKENSTNGNSAVLKGFYSVNTGTNANDLKTAVNNINVRSAYTNSGEGMNLAKLLMNSYARTDTETEKYSRTVVMFTDGVPCNSGQGQTWNADIANAAISNAKTMKGNGITVFTVGILSGYSDDSDVIRYMNAVSSNYPNATGYTTATMGSPIENPNFYKNASDGNLEGIFEDIAKETTGGGSDVAMNATNTTVVLDIMTNYFKLPKGSASEINLYTSDIDIAKSNIETETPAFQARVAWAPWNDDAYKNAKNEDGTLKYDSDGDKDVDKDDFILINKSVMGIEITDSDKDYLEVTGYDYAEHYVGVDTETDESGTTKSWHSTAQKLIIEFVIEKDPANTGGVELPTNDAGSGVYTKDSKTGEYGVIENYEQPYTYLPYLKVVKTGMKNGQSAIFTITGKNTNAMVILTQGSDLAVSPSAIIKLRDAGNYTVTENTGWSWEYGKVSYSTNGTSWTAFPEGTTTYSLTQELTHADTWTADNCYLTYYFKNETESSVKHDESAVNNIFYEEGTVTGRDIK